MKYLIAIITLTLLIGSVSKAQEITEEDTAAATGEESVADPSTEESAEEAPVVSAKVAAARNRSSASWNVGLSLLQWNENLKIIQAGTTSSDFANYNGMMVSVQKETIYYRWGYSAAAFLGAGRANGGGMGTYLADRVAFNVIGVQPRIFWRYSGRINVGVSAMAFMKNIDWPTAALETVDSGRKTNIMGLADMNIRLFQKYDLYQGIGPLAEGSTLWRVGVNYRF